MIKAIIFDYGGVLSNEASLAKFAEINAPKYRADPKKCIEIIRNTWHKARVNEINSRIFWKNLGEFLGEEPNIIRKKFDDYFGFNEEVFNFIKKLKPKYRLAMISNHIEDWLNELIERYKLNELFEVIVTSYNSKVAKPDPKIYLEAINKLKVEPSECVFIDDMERNMPEARELGIKTIVFKDLEQLKKELIALGADI